MPLEALYISIVYQRCTSAFVHIALSKSAERPSSFLVERFKP